MAKDCYGVEYTTNDGSAPTSGTPVRLPDGTQGTWMGHVVK